MNMNKKIFALVAAALLTGCASATAAPFHMYSSPLLEGEMESPRDASRAVLGDDGASPGVKSPQVYAYQRYSDHPAPTDSRQAVRIARRSDGYAPPLDTVAPASKPVLANYAWDPDQPSGAGRATTDDGGAPSAPAPADPQADEEISPEVAADAPPADSAPAAPGEVDAEQPAASPASGQGPQNDSDFSADAAEYIYRTLRANEIDLGDDASRSIPSLYRSCRTAGEMYHTSRPEIGDVVFFHNTHDANGDGRNNNWYTLVGIVESVHRDGTVEFLAYRGDGVDTLRLNLDRLGQQTGDRNQTINSKLRTPTADDPPFTQYLAGQLFAGYCNVLGTREDLVLIDNWQPGMEL